MTVAGEAERWAAAIEADLRAVGTPERVAAEKAYLKSDLAFLGTGVPAMRQVMRRFLVTQPALDRIALLALGEALWREPLHERRMAAVELLDARGNLLEAGDLALVERLIRGSKTWALVDTLAIRIAGRLVVRFPELSATLDRWAADGDFWVRRSALLALLEPLRRGGGDFERFGRYADAMLEETEFFIRKAIGWVLRELSKKQSQVVYAWLAPRSGRSSGVTMREAVKYLPAAQRDELLAAYRAHRPAAG
jgi:3-methyladenine DNA glycosylase AlkD